MEFILDRLKRNLNIINTKKHSYIEVESGKYNGRQLNLKEKHDLTYQLAMELITWLINTDDLLYKNFPLYKDLKRQSHIYNQSMYGLRHAYNLFKHDMTILSVEKQKHTLLFQTGNTNYFLESTIWVNIDKLHVSDENKNARKAYKKYLEEKTLYDVFNYLVRELNHYYYKIIV